MIAFLLTTIAGFATGIGSLMALFVKRDNKKILPISMGFSAGVMIYVSLVELFINSKDSLISSFGDFNGYLINGIQDALDAYYSTPEDSPEREAAGAVLEDLFKQYWQFKNIVSRVYDVGDLEEPKKPSGFDTGGYTGEWGDEGRLAFLHEKELVLNADDTANFLTALGISRQLIEMIEMNAKASSLGLGDMIASTIKDNSQTIEQQVYITAEFPEATNHSEIEEAFDNIINLASQYAFRRD
jgi:hypothetical protein